MASPPDPNAGLDPRVVRTRHDVLDASTALMISEGLEAVTQPNVARRAGYSKVTVYAHWPDRLDLVRDTFAWLGDMPHFEPTGDVRTDLIGELESFKQAMVEHRLDRILAVLAERSTIVPELAEIRTRFIADGERPLRRILSSHLSRHEADTATGMLSGVVVHATLMHGRPPSRRTIESAVDIVLKSAASRR